MTASVDARQGIRKGLADTMNVDIDINKIFEYLPHRYPFLLVDRVTDITEFESIRAIKNVTYNEPFFTGHFPVKPVMPGVLILEAMAQVTGIFAFYSYKLQANEDSMYYLVGVDRARFRKPVVPGDQLVLTATLGRKVRGIYRFACEAHVDGELVAAGEFMTTEMSA